MKKSIAIVFILGLLIPTLSAFAKGDFDYIAVRGPGLTGEVNITDPALTQDFFVFADFSQGPIDPPPDPGEGYEVVRVHVVTENSKPTPTPFDLLYYYPYAGYVFYQGLVNGSSEYDGKWYIANPAANDPFRAALTQRALLTWIPFAVLACILIWFFVAYRRKPKSATLDGEA